MTRFRTLLVFIPGLLSLVAGCGDDDDVVAAGASGSSGAAGTTNGTAGSSAGVSGSNGTAGASATAGTSSGASGTAGESGTSGGSGTSGASGGSGSSSGTSGGSGTAGASATAGTAGSAGDSGSAGVSGTAGESGAAGEAGNAGTAGVAGSAGAAGNSGASGAAGASSSKWLMGYYPGYQQSDMPVEQIPFDRMTHLAVGAVLPQANGSLDTSFYIGNNNGPALATDLTTRAHAAGRKAILMVGGAGAHDGFVAAASSAQTTFVSNLVTFAQSHGFDGIDLDWEPLPESELSSFDALAKAIRLAWPEVILTVPVETININYETVPASWAQISSSFDQVNLMTYSMAGAYEGWQSWHHSPLDGAGPTTPKSIKSSVTAWLGAGVPAAKLGIGAGFYGMCYTSPVTAPKQNLGGSTASGDDNQLAYRTLLSSYITPAARHYDDTAQTPYLSWSSPTGPMNCTYLSYTDEQSLTAQAAFIQAQNLGGAIVWTINEGHLGAGAADRDPLLTALYSGLN